MSFCRCSQGAAAYAQDHKCYLSAVSHLYIQYGRVDLFASALFQLTNVLRGVRRTQSERHIRQRLSITPIELATIKAVWSPQPLRYDTVMPWAACCTGFFVFLRANEFIMSSLSAVDPAPHLTSQDIPTYCHQNSTLVGLHLKQSKTDPFRRGADVHLARSANEICPVSSLLAYMTVKGTRSGTLFISATVVLYPVSNWCKRCNRRCRQQVLHCSGFTGHSLQIRAASTAKTRGINDSTIKALGRWKSKSFEEHIKLSARHLARWSK